MEVAKNNLSYPFFTEVQRYDEHNEDVDQAQFKRLAQMACTSHLEDRLRHGSHQLPIRYAKVSCQVHFLHLQPGRRSL